MRTTERVTVEGRVSKGFEPVRDAFVENFTERHELGGACCVYRAGEQVVDLWGGVRNRETGEAWEERTMVLVNSATKGLAASMARITTSRSWSSNRRLRLSCCQGAFASTSATRRDQSKVEGTTASSRRSFRRYIAMTAGTNSRPSSASGVVNGTAG